MNQKNIMKTQIKPSSLISQSITTRRDTPTTADLFTFHHKAAEHLLHNYKAPFWCFPTFSAPSLVCIQMFTTSLNQNGQLTFIWTIWSFQTQTNGVCVFMGMAVVGIRGLTEHNGIKAEDSVGLILLLLFIYVELVSTAGSIEQHCCTAAQGDASWMSMFPAPAADQPHLLQREDCLPDSLLQWSGPLTVTAACLTALHAVCRISAALPGFSRFLVNLRLDSAAISPHLTHTVSPCPAHPTSALLSVYTRARETRAGYMCLPRADVKLVAVTFKLKRSQEVI